MSCPHCQRHLEKITIPVRIDSMYACYEANMINCELGRYFDFNINASNHQTTICTDCGSKWKFKVELCNSNVKSGYSNLEWYEIVASKLAC